MRNILPALCLLLAACATIPAGQAGSDVPDAITLETGPCFGTCPVYRVTVNADGSGSFEGRRFTAFTGIRRFEITPDQYRAFVRHLAPLRPASPERRYSGEACAMMATDLPSTEVSWIERGASRTLYFYHGCDMEKNRAIAQRLNAAPGLLPIGDMIRSPD